MKNFFAALMLIAVATLIGCGPGKPNVGESKDGKTTITQDNPGSALTPVATKIADDERE